MNVSFYFSVDKFYVHVYDAFQNDIFKIAINIFLPCLSRNEKVFSVFQSRIQTYRLFIERERCLLIVLL